MQGFITFNKNPLATTTMYMNLTFEYITLDNLLEDMPAVVKGTNKNSLTITSPVLQPITLTNLLFTQTTFGTDSTFSVNANKAPYFTGSLPEITITENDATAIFEVPYIKDPEDDWYFGYAESVLPTLQIGLQIESPPIINAIAYMGTPAGTYNIPFYLYDDRAGAGDEMTSETTLKVTVLPYVEPDPEIEIIGDDTFLQKEYL